MLLKAVSDRHEAAAFPARSTASDSEKDWRTGWRKIKDIGCHWMLKSFCAFTFPHSDSTTSSKIPSLDVSSASQSSATPGQIGWKYWFRLKCSLFIWVLCSLTFFSPGALSQSHSKPVTQNFQQHTHLWV